MQLTRVLQYLEALTALGTAPHDPLPRIRERSGAVLFATVGKLLEATAKLDVRIDGRLVGEVRLRGKADRVFRPVNPWSATWEHCDLDWASAEVLRFLHDRMDDLPRKDAEAKVQSALFLAMRERKGSKKLDALRWNQPVQMLGMPFQFPLPISASGPSPEVAKGQALGHADILARSRAGHRIKVLELKRPGGDAPHALAQGVAYAAAIRTLLRTNPAVVIKALGYGKPRKRLPGFEVWAFVDVGDAPDVRASAPRLQEANHHFDLHMLPYRMDGAGRLVLGAPEILGRAVPA